MRKRTFIPFNDLSSQYLQLRKEMDQAWHQVAQSGWFVLGEQLLAFEKEFAGYLGAGHALGVGSGTEALHLALVACGIGLGDEVITVPNTAVPTVSAISAAGAKPVFTDIDPVTYTMNPAQIQKKITFRTKAIIPVHLYGHPADMDPIKKLAKKHKLYVIEDACQAHGTEYKGRKVGLLGDMGCFSFYPTKNLGAYGDGGMVVTHQKVLAQRVGLLRNYGQKERYHHLTKGFNSRLDELQAAILRKKLKKLKGWNNQRRYLAQLYSSALKDLPVVIPAESPWAKHCFHLYVIRTGKRNQLRRWLGSRGVETLIHYPIPVHRQQAYRELKLPAGSFPITEQVSREILSLPLYPELQEGQVKKIAKTIQDFFNENG